MPKLTHEEIDRQVEEAMKTPPTEQLQRFKEMIAARGGRVEQPFPEEKVPRERETRLPSLPARTQV